MIWQDASDEDKRERLETRRTITILGVFLICARIGLQAELLYEDPKIVLRKCKA